MSAVAVQRFTYAEWSERVQHPTRDKSYLETRLGPAVRDFLAWKRLGRTAERTLDTYERDLARLSLALGHLSLEEIGVSDLMLVLATLPEGSWRRYRAAWNGLFRWAQAFGHRPDNPVDRLPPMRPTPPKVYDIFNESEQQALVNEASATLFPELDRARMMLLIETGARKGEARRMRPKHIDLAQRLVVVYGKGKKARLVPIRGEVVAALDLALVVPLPRLGRSLNRGEHLWFPAKWKGDTVLAVYPERPMSERGFHEWWTRIAKPALGEDYRKLHTTRHTFATDALDAGNDLYDVKELLGHSSTRVTEVYIHSSRKRLDSAADRLARFRGRK